MSKAVCHSNKYIMWSCAGFGPIVGETVSQTVDSQFSIKILVSCINNINFASAVSMYTCSELVNKIVLQSIIFMNGSVRETHVKNLQCANGDGVLVRQLHKRVRFYSVCGDLGERWRERGEPEGGGERLCLKNLLQLDSRNVNFNQMVPIEPRWYSFRQGVPPNFMRYWKKLHSIMQVIPVRL